ncbi:MAG: CDP-alcohol phosphatidyltransferase family protein [Rhodocyclales bacterium]|nr:CDP-alcohol phosphatidyltransferase family protein [Rhodocyclales bacterium]
MTALLARVFSDRYANQAAIGPNLLLMMMYRFAYPFSVALSAARVSPNQITTLSVLFAAVAALALAFDDRWWLFCVFWWLALLMDFCDGTVARMTDTVRNTAFRYDHTSDLFKVFLVVLAVGIRYDTTPAWVVSFSASFFFMFYMVVNHDLVSARKRVRDASPLAGAEANTSPAGPDRGGPGAFRKALYAAVFTINGHTLLVFFVLSLGEDVALLGLTYFLVLSALRAAICINAMVRLPK